MLSSTSGRHAVVIGGSIAGLLAGRVLADTFERVTIIERDRFPDGPAFRKGVPQARHVHVLLKRGQMVLERLFPDIAAELLDAGVPQVDWIADSQALSGRGWLPRFETNLKGICPAAICWSGRCASAWRSTSASPLKKPAMWWDCCPPSTLRAWQGCVCAPAATRLAWARRRNWRLILWWTPAGAIRTRRNG